MGHFFCDYGEVLYLILQLIEQIHYIYIIIIRGSLLIINFKTSLSQRKQQIELNFVIIYGMTETGF